MKKFLFSAALRFAVMADSHSLPLRRAPNPSSILPSGSDNDWESLLSMSQSLEQSVHALT